ncbi:MAG: ribose-5-phosphate isomerase RpiA [Acetobacteraceae bacterium]|nr:ribose-5-phosphate isomerase RpiA [Acetobacteraceae bacterium]
MNQDSLKRQAAEAAVALVESGMVVGLGTGSTAAFAIDGLIRRVREERLDIVAIPTSERSDAQARQGGIRLTDFAAHHRVDLTIDGADEIALGSLDLVKGLGGALLREKIVAAASSRLVIIADASKLVERLGSTVRVPVEVVPFGWQTTLDRIGALGGNPVLRPDKAGEPFRTDGGNLILDCAFGPLADAGAMEQALSNTIGVVETGLFIGMAASAMVATADGVRRLDRM